MIEEGSEPSEFWEELHGEGEYDRSVNDLGAPLLEPRLFHCQLVAWRTKVEEVREFKQTVSDLRAFWLTITSCNIKIFQDLDVDDVMLLDAGDEIYMWVGSGASVEENAKILQMARVIINTTSEFAQIFNICFCSLEIHQTRTYRSYC